MDSWDSHELLASLLKETWRGGRQRNKADATRKTSGVISTFERGKKKRSGESCQSRKGRLYFIPTFETYQLENWNGGSSSLFCGFSGKVISHLEGCHTPHLILCPESDSRSGSLPPTSLVLFMEGEVK